MCFWPTNCICSGHLCQEIFGLLRLHFFTSFDIFLKDVFEDFRKKKRLIYIFEFTTWKLHNLNYTNGPIHYVSDQQHSTLSM